MQMNGVHLERMRILVADGISAIKHFRRYDYSLAILEAHLPELNGKIVARQLRKMIDIPFVFLSSDSDENSILDAFTLGAEDCIIKPFSLRMQVVSLAVSEFQARSFHRNTRCCCLFLHSAYAAVIVFPFIITLSISFTSCHNEDIASLRPLHSVYGIP